MCNKFRSQNRGIEYEGHCALMFLPPGKILFSKVFLAILQNTCKNKSDKVENAILDEAWCTNIAREMSGNTLGGKGFGHQTEQV